MKTRRTLRLLIVSLVLALGLTVASMFLAIHSSDQYDRTQNGWPLVYKRTIDTRGDCIGFLDELPSQDGSCGIHHFPVSYTNLLLNFLFYVATIATVGAVIGKLIRRRG